MLPETLRVGRVLQEETPENRIPAFRIENVWGRLGGSVGGASDFGSRHGPAVCELEPHLGVSAVSLPAQSPLQVLGPHPSAPSPHALSQNRERLRPQEC